MLLQLSKTVKQSPKSPQIFENNGTFCADRPFSKNRSETNCQKSFVFNQLVSELQSYILSTTTETSSRRTLCTSRQTLQSYILSTTTETLGGRNQNTLERCFNRTSFQQQLKLAQQSSGGGQAQRFNRTSFQQQLKPKFLGLNDEQNWASIVHPFNNNWNGSNLRLVFVTCSKLQSYILSTTTETTSAPGMWKLSRFNRTSFQQQLKHFRRRFIFCPVGASIVHPFNNNWNLSQSPASLRFPSLQSYILSTTTETRERVVLNSSNN